MSGKTQTVLVNRRLSSPPWFFPAQETSKIWCKKIAWHSATGNCPVTVISSHMNIKIQTLTTTRENVYLQASWTLLVHLPTNSESNSWDFYTGNVMVSKRYHVPLGFQQIGKRSGHLGTYNPFSDFISSLKHYWLSVQFVNLFFAEASVARMVWSPQGCLFGEELFVVHFFTIWRSLFTSAFFHILIRILNLWKIKFYPANL